MLAPYTEAHGEPGLLALGVRSLALFDDFIAGLADATGRPFEYARTGTLEVALDGADGERLASAKRALDAIGVSSDLLDPPAMRALEPAASASAVGALLTHAHGFVGVEALIRALVHRARFAGAVFESPAESVHVEDRGTSVEVRVGERLDTADYVVVAAGSWSGRVRVKHVPVLPVRPVRGQLLHLTWAGARPPSRIVWGPRCYAVPWSDGTLLVGATVEDVGFDESATPAGVGALTAAVSELLPGSAAARFQGVRVGLRPSVADGLPVIGPIRRAPRVVMATGHYRNGVLLAPVTAEIVARYVLEGVIDPAVDATTPDRFLFA
jgi:glycine oxidase